MFQQIHQTATSMRLFCRIGLVAAAVSLPVTAHAKPIDRVQARVDQVKTRVDQTYKQVNRIRGHVSEIVTDLREKKAMLQEAGVEQLHETVRSILEYMQDAQADYADFVAPDDCGPSSECGAFREQLRGLIQEFAALPDELAFVERAPAAVDRLYEAADLVDRLPPPILYASQKALGNSIDEVYALVDILLNAAARMPDLPTSAELQQALQDRQDGRQAAGATRWEDNCSTIPDNPHIALVRVTLQQIGASLKDLAGFFKDNESITIAAFGYNFKQPAKAFLQGMAFVSNSLDRKVERKVALVESICALR